MKKSFYRWRVRCAYFVAILAFALARPTRESLLIGLALALPGQALRVWASGHLEKTRRLATGGPYSFTQHPLYLGNILISAGVAIASGRLVVVLVTAAYLLVFFPYVLRSERQFLDNKFGEEYRTWTAAVPTLVPRLVPAGPRDSRFTWGRVLINHEWRACLAYVVVFVLLTQREHLF